MGKVPRNCTECRNSYTGYGQSKFCSRSCYEAYRQSLKFCGDCGKKRCKEHARLKTAKWREVASRQELKAKSMQVSHRQGTGRTLTLEDARLLIVRPPQCPYCHKAIPWEQLSIDHRVPKSRGGDNEPSNIVWVDLPCNQIKGNLLDTEFQELLRFLNDHPTIKPILLMRLKAAGLLYKKWR